MIISAGDELRQHDAALPRFSGRWGVREERTGWTWQHEQHTLPAASARVMQKAQLVLAVNNKQPKLNCQQTPKNLGLQDLQGM